MVQANFLPEGSAPKKEDFVKMPGLQGKVTIAAVRDACRRACGVGSCSLSPCRVNKHKFDFRTTARQK